jgi:hypothetical protein
VEADAESHGLRDALAASEERVRGLEARAAAAAAAAAAEVARLKAGWDADEDAHREAQQGLRDEVRGHINVHSPWGKARRRRVRRARPSACVEKSASRAHLTRFARATPRQVERLSGRALGLAREKEQLQGSLEAAEADLAVSTQQLAAAERWGDGGAQRRLGGRRARACRL